MKLVVRIGGSILGSPPKAEMVESYCSALLSLASEGNRIGVVVGGGKIARKFIKIARELNLPHYKQDMVAIDISRVNAHIFSMKLGINIVPRNIGSMISVLESRGIGVMGGLKPGITTDTVAALLSTRWDADLLVKCSDQLGIYSADPKKYKDAKKLNSTTYEELARILGGEHRPGIHSIVDPVAVNYLMQKRVRMVVIDGSDPTNLIRAVKGEKIGTVVD